MSLALLAHLFDLLRNLVLLFVVSAIVLHPKIDHVVAVAVVKVVG